MRTVALAWICLVFVGCGPKGTEEPVLSVGSIHISQSDFDHYLQERFGGEPTQQQIETAQRSLSETMQLAAFASHQGLVESPEFRLRQIELLANIAKRDFIIKPKEESTVSPEEVRAYYEKHKDRYQIPEKRAYSVLWVPKGEPTDLNYARDFARKNFSANDLIEKGFDTLAVDFTHHAPHRFKGAQQVSLDLETSRLFPDKWMRKAAETAFQLKSEGELSEVIELANGDQLLVATQSITKSQVIEFATVESKIETIIKNEKQKAHRAEFQQTLEASFPVEQ